MYDILYQPFVTFALSSAVSDYTASFDRWGPLFPVTQSYSAAKIWGVLFEVSMIHDDRVCREQRP